MSNIIPVKAIRSGSNVVAMGEMISSDTIPASIISNTAAGEITSTNIQAAINELSQLKISLSNIKTINTQSLVGSGDLTIISMSDDVSSDLTLYPMFNSITTGSVTATKVASTKLTFNPSSGNLSSTLFTSLSDISKKTNITSISNSLEIISKLNPVNFRWIDNNKPSIGLIAQELEEFLPELVETDNSTGLKSINYDGLIGILIAAIQELIQEK